MEVDWQIYYALSFIAILPLFRIFTEMGLRALMVSSYALGYGLIYYFI
jgi:hypothetical protein